VRLDGLRRYPKRLIKPVGKNEPGPAQHADNEGPKRRPRSLTRLHNHCTPYCQQRRPRPDARPNANATKGAAGGLCVQQAGRWAKQQTAPDQNKAPAVILIPDSRYAHPGSCRGGPERQAPSNRLAFEIRRVRPRVGLSWVGLPVSRGLESKNEKQNGEAEDVLTRRSHGGTASF
jgi:hypothetical protein